MGLWDPAAIVPVYPTLPPPAATKSTKGPPLIEISRTAPSFPFSKSKLCVINRKVPLVGPLTKEGVSRMESVTQPGASWNTQLGVEAGAVVLVTQFVPDAQV